MKANARIRQSRQDRGLSENQVADLLGISISSYCDVEAYEDEWLDLPLEKIRTLSSSLGLDIHQFLEPTVSGDASGRKAHRALIADALRTSGKSVAELSDEINVKESVLNEVLSDAHALEQWLMSFVLSLCQKLGIPLRAIV
jgi:transcriptional regulator with XRE-family HTH domain